MPSSTYSTSNGAAFENNFILLSILVIALLYALLSTVPFVAMTPTLLDSVAAHAVLAPASITPVIGMSNLVWISGSAEAVAVLQATTISLTFCLYKKSAMLRANILTSF